VPTQRCTVHKHRNLLAHAPDHLHDEVSADYTDMIYIETAKEIEERRKAFLRKWRLKCRAVADSLEEAGDRLFTFTRLPPPSGARPAPPMPSNGCTRNSSAASRPRPPRPSCRRRTAAMLFWVLIASGQIATTFQTAPCSCAKKRRRFAALTEIASAAVARRLQNKRG
jgi:hypothetical protein